MSESRDNVPSPHDKLLHDAEAIVDKAQECPSLPRLILEVQVKDALRHVYPFSVSSTELGTRLGIPDIGRMLGYLASYGEVERTGHGKYRHREESHAD